MTNEEILQLLYDETLVGNAPVVRDGVNEGLEQGSAGSQNAAAHNDLI